jgi:two-component system nitrate/nitrite response regulator NarL
MRVLLVGSAAERARLRNQLGAESIEVAGEFASLSAARAAGADVDGIIIATPVDDEDAVPDPLTARELEVLELIAEGLPNKGIAGRLGISDQTVKFHVASISGKLGAANRTDIVRRAARRGLIAL